MNHHLHCGWCDFVLSAEAASQDEMCPQCKESLYERGTEECDADHMSVFNEAASLLQVREVEP